MPNKPKSKKFKRTKQLQQKTAYAATTDNAAGIQTETMQKPALKTTPSTTKAAAIQYDPEQFKYVTTELKVAGIISTIIIIIIIALNFIL